MKSLNSPLPQQVPLSLNCRGRLLRLDKVRIMAILNLTPDSFSDGGRYNEADQAYSRVEQMLSTGADIIDIGGFSSRPGAVEISPSAELLRIEKISEGILQRFPEAFISIDTFRASVAEAMLERGVHMINDISSGALDPQMWETLVRFGDVPYIMMHMQGRPDNMQENPLYGQVFEEVYQYLVEKINAARALGLRDIVIDPGFGFGKTMLHNYQLLGNLQAFGQMGVPLLIGISRKSMLYKFFDTGPEEVLAPATAMHFWAMQQGAKILRVHDVAEAKRISTLFTYLQENGIV